MVTFLLRLLAYFWDERCVYLALEYAASGNLRRLVKNRQVSLLATREELAGHGSKELWQPKASRNLVFSKDVVICFTAAD